MSARPFKLTIAALGGQGGGVLSDWLIHVAESQGHLVQSTSVPGVAQRTGATIYYLEFFPRDAAERAGREPILALMPVAGDVDCVVAAELVEAGRAVQRGLVTPDRTTLIASSHRTYTIAERSALGRNTADETQLEELARSQAKHLILFDMAEMAERHASVISSVLLGAIAGSKVLPFSRKSFEDAIHHSGISVQTNLAAFAAAYEKAGAGASSPTRVPAASLLAQIPAQAQSVRMQPLLDRVRRLPEALQPVAFEGARRLVDYQDAAYASLYLQRIESVLRLDQQHATHNSLLSETVARHLALWMSFEDTIRVADLKTRGARFTRVRSEVRVAPNQLLGITEFMKPRVEEIAGTMPAALGRWVRGSSLARRVLSRFTRPKKVRTSTISGFVMLRLVAGMRRWRLGTLRYREENAHMMEWLDAIERLAATNYGLAVEVARMQRLVKGYGDTHERGWRNFSALMGRIIDLEQRSDGAVILARLHETALADEEGLALQREMQLTFSGAAVGRA